MTLEIARRTGPWAANDPAGVMAWVSGGVTGTSEGTLGDIVVPAFLVPGDSRTTEVDELFRRDESLRCVVLETPGGPVLVDRTSFEAALTGRLGYGRVLYSRRAVVEMVTEATLVMAHDAPIAAAGAAVLARRTPGMVANAVVVRMPDGSLGVAHVSTIFERLAHDYAYQSLHDPLTHLPNRVYLMEQFRQSTDGDWSGVLFIDLDRFKDVNDSLGHAVGDQLLAQVGPRLRSILRPGDTIARLGGDEFAVLLPVANDDAAKMIADRLAHQLDDPFVIDGMDLHVEASIGIAVSHRPGRDEMSTTESLFREADHSDNEKPIKF